MIMTGAWLLTLRHMSRQMLRQMLRKLSRQISRLRSAVLLGALFAAAGCVSLEAPSVNTTASLPGTRTVTAAAADNAISVGKSTRSDVESALGRTTRISFDSGYEVWVYRWSGGAPASRAANRTENATEFIVLFNPSGVVAKTRLRQPPPPAQRG